MNIELKRSLNKINESFNKLSDSLNIKFKKDIVEVSLAQFLLNICIENHSGVWVPPEDITRIEEYINFKIEFKNKDATLEQMKEYHHAIPMIFYYMNIIYELDLKNYNFENYNAILSLFSSIAFDVNNNFKDKNVIDERNVNNYNSYIDWIKSDFTKFQPNQKDIKDVILNLNNFCKYVNNVIDEKYDNDGKNDADNNSNNISKESVESILEELNSYVGLNKVKEEISQLIDLLQMRKKREENGLKNPQMTYHLCFMGNPGTGKTTVARIIAKLYKTLGIVKKGHLIEVSRQDLVGEYVGQTAVKTKEVIKKAYNGILFIDEAYSLSNKNSGNDYGKEAIEVLLKEMEDHRDKLVVIVAGYDNLMKDFLSSNPGLESRFNTFIHFEDYSSNELMKIIESIALKNDYIIDEECKKYLEKNFELVYSKKDDDFANARYVRNLFENAIKNQASRISKLGDNIEVEELKKLIVEDFME